MFKEAFEKLDLEKVATILEDVNPLIEGMQFDPVETTILALPLSFYPGHRLLDIADYTVMPSSHRYLIYGPKKTAILNFTNQPIYDLNKQISIRLNDDNVSEYLKFFFSFVRGRHGRFLLCENVDDIRWKDDPPPQARKAIGRMVMPITILKRNDDGGFEIQATMTFKDSLFKSMITVKPDGHVNLHGEELLVEDMPVLDDTFGQ